MQGERWFLGAELYARASSDLAKEKSDKSSDEHQHEYLSGGNPALRKAAPPTAGIFDVGT